jgi:hypothetical protein
MCHTKSPVAGIDADLLVKVASLPNNHPICVGGAIAAALPVLFEEATRRPIFGILLTCNLGQKDFSSDLGVIMHEMLHIIVRSTSLYAPAFSAPAFGRAEQQTQAAEQCGAWPLRTHLMWRMATAHAPDVARCHCSVALWSTVACVRPQLSCVAYDSFSCSGVSSTQALPVWSCRRLHRPAPERVLPCRRF